jgi:hypothetical protein
MTTGPIVTGIPSLGPGEERRIDWGQYAGLKKSLGDEPVYLTCTYDRPHYFLGMPFGKKLSTTSVLEVDSFLHTAANEAPESRIARSLEKLAGRLQHAFPGGSDPRRDREQREGRQRRRRLARMSWRAAPALSLGDQDDLGRRHANTVRCGSRG